MFCVAIWDLHMQSDFHCYWKAPNLPSIFVCDMPSEYACLKLFWFCQLKGQLPLKELMRRRSWQSIGRTGAVTIPAVATLWNGTHNPKMADEWAGNKSWKEMKRISTNHERWRVGIFDALCPIKGWMVTIYMYKVIVFEYFFTFECPDKIFNLQRNLLSGKHTGLQVSYKPTNIKCPEDQSWILFTLVKESERN